MAPRCGHVCSYTKVLKMRNEILQQEHHENTIQAELKRPEVRSGAMYNNILYAFMTIFVGL